MLRYVLLGLLHAEPRYGYELKAVFEHFLGGTWPLNVGQVYATLARLERDGLVECQVVPQDGVPDRKVYALTAAGREELQRWVGAPDEGPVRLRDEFFLKIAVRSLDDSPGAAALISRQRQAHLSALAELTEQAGDAVLHPTTALLLEAAMGRLEADLRWLDVCEERLK
ncbi:MAG: PadR family transcriptional regulator [Acidimicrobiales bacterium]